MTDTPEYKYSEKPAIQLFKKWIEIKREETVLEELSSKNNIYVLVDEAHRSQYGFLAAQRDARSNAT